MRLLTYLGALLLAAAASPEPENGVVGQPEVRCGATSITVVTHTAAPFGGRLYVQGEAEAEGCVRRPKGATESVEFELGFGECGMRRQRTLSPRGVTYSFTLVVSFHPVFVTGTDRGFNVRCFFLESVKALEAEVDVGRLTTSVIEKSFDLPSCTYSIHEASPTGPPVKYARVGDAVAHVWNCGEGAAPAYGMLIHSCYVDDGAGARFELIDDRGCGLDRVLLPVIEYESGALVASARSSIFKYADKIQVFFTCTVQLCFKKDGGCDGLTPPVCDGAPHPPHPDHPVLLMPSGGVDHHHSPPHPHSEEEEERRPRLPLPEDHHHRGPPPPPRRHEDDEDGADDDDDDERRPHHPPRFPPPQPRGGGGGPHDHRPPHFPPRHGGPPQRFGPREGSHERRGPPQRGGGGDRNDGPRGRFGPPPHPRRGGSREEEDEAERPPPPPRGLFPAEGLPEDIKNAFESKFAPPGKEFFGPMDRDSEARRRLDSPLLNRGSSAESEKLLAPKPNSTTDKQRPEMLLLPSGKAPASSSSPSPTSGLDAALQAVASVEYEDDDGGDLDEIQALLNATSEQQQPLRYRTDFVSSTLSTLFAEEDDASSSRPPPSSSSDRPEEEASREDASDDEMIRVSTMAAPLKEAPPDTTPPPVQYPFSSTGTIFRAIDSPDIVVEKSIIDEAKKQRTSRGSEQKKKLETDLSVDVIVLPFEEDKPSAPSTLHAPASSSSASSRPVLCLSAAGSSLLLSGVLLALLMVAAVSFTVARRSYRSSSRGPEPLASKRLDLF